MGHYPHQDFYYGFLCRIPQDEETSEELYEFFGNIRDENDLEREIGFRSSGDMTSHTNEGAVVGVKINEKYGSGERVIVNMPSKRSEYRNDMSYLGGYHTGEFLLDTFEKELKKAKEIFEELDLEEKLKQNENLDLTTAQPSIVTVSWYG